MKTRHLILGSAALLLAAAGQGLAATTDAERLKEVEKYFSSPYTEEMYFRTDRLLLTATGSLLPVSKAPSVASVITKEDIEEMGATTLDEVLETVPGLYVGVGQGSMLSSVWSIRGIRTDLNPQVLLLINGVPFTSVASGGRPHTFRMPVAMVSRVEVVRGPGSAVHGADAFAGTVNVITKDGQEVDGLATGLRAGSFETYDAWVQYGWHQDDWDVVLSVEGQRSAGDDDRVVARDAYSNFLGPPWLAPPGGSQAPGPLDTRYRFVESHLGVRKGKNTVRLYHSLLDDNGGGPGIFQVLNDSTDIDGNYLLADFVHENKELARDWDFSLHLSSLYLHQDNFFQYFPSGTVNQLGNPIVETWDGALEGVALFTGHAAHRLRLAAGLKHWDMETDQYKNFGAGIPPPAWYGPLQRFDDSPFSFMDDQARWLWHASAQDEWHLARHWDLTAGLRFDDYSDFGSTTNPRAALVWEALPVLTSKILYGRAFRAPSFTEQYFRKNPVQIGNPAIQPEEIETYELVLDYQPIARLRQILSLFSYTTDGLIEYSGPTPAGEAPSAKSAENSRAQKGYGFELEMLWEPTDDFRFRYSFAYQRSKDEDTGEMVPNTPAGQLLLNPHWRFLPDWSLDGQLYWVVGRRRAKEDTRPPIDDYELVNLTLRRKAIAEHVDLAFAVRNLFDEDVREPSPPSTIPDDYPMPSRSFWVELRFSP
ncbi:MAG: TonB-dependent receptor [Thermodesulfobacteriota bacterium]